MDSQRAVQVDWKKIPIGHHRFKKKKDVRNQSHAFAEHILSIMAVLGFVLFCVFNQLLKSSIYPHFELTNKVHCLAVCRTRVFLTLST